MKLLRGMYVVVVIALIGIGAIALHRHLRDNRWAARNESALRAVPVYPGAVEVSASSDRLENNETGAFQGYRSERAYRLPPGAKDKVAAFYRDRLGDRLRPGKAACDVFYRSPNNNPDVDIEIQGCSDRLVIRAWSLSH